MIKTLNQHVLFRYLVSGGTSAFVDLSTLYLLHTVWGVYYLYAAVEAFILAFFFSFALHKFWTFQNRSMQGAHIQAVRYLGTSLFGLGLNTILMYFFVDHEHVPVLISQIIVGLLVACCTFSLSRKFVFKHRDS